VWLVHALFAALMAYMMWSKLRVRGPRKARAPLRRPA